MRALRLICLNVRFLDRFVPICVCIFSVVAGAAILSGCSTTTETKLIGLIQSSKTDENDNPVSIYLWDGKAGYPIEANNNMSALLEKIDSKVEAEVDLVETYSGEKTILIKKYRVLKEAGD